MKKTISIYDYVIDANNYTYVVRGRLNKHIQAKLLYTYDLGIRNKHKLYNGINTGHAPFLLGDSGDFLLKGADIIKVVSPTIIDLLCFPAKVRGVCETIIATGATVKLFGSRLLANNNLKSDWDILVETDAHPLDLMDLVLKENHGFRKFNINELQIRMRRYGQGIICPNHELLKYLSQATLYLKYDDEELGVFFRRKTSQEDLSRSPIKNIFGKSIYIKVDSSNGQSFYMPRMIKGTDQQGRKVSILSTKWALQGLEIFAGKTIQFNGNWMEYQSGLKWFGGENSTIKVL